MPIPGGGTPGLRVEKGGSLRELEGMDLPGSRVLGQGGAAGQKQGLPTTALKAK